MIPRRPQKKEEKEVHPKYQDGSDGPMVDLEIPTISRSKTRRAKSVGTWPLLEWDGDVLSTAENQDPAEDEEEAGAAEPGTSERKQMQATTPQLGEDPFNDQESSAFIPRVATASESPTDWVQIRQSSPLDTTFDPYQQTADSVGDQAVSTPRDEVSSSGKKRRRTILHKLFRVKQ